MAPRVIRHGRTDSTNERALAALADGSARHGDAHVADEQTAGRGRLGRRWESAAGAGLYLSVVFLPEPPAPNPAALTMAAGLAVLQAVHALGARTARLKWPNDVLVPDGTGAGAKLAGILVEARGLDPKRPHAVVGVGLNVAQRAFAPELLAERAVTSLALLGLTVTREEALDALLPLLLARLDEASTAPARVAAEYARASELLGREVRVQDGRSETVGRLEGLTLAGLELATRDGRRVRIALEHARAVESTESGQLLNAPVDTPKNPDSLRPER